MGGFHIRAGFGNFDDFGRLGGHRGTLTKSKNYIIYLVQCYFSDWAERILGFAIMMRKLRNYFYNFFYTSSIISCDVFCVLIYMFNYIKIMESYNEQ